MDLDLSAGQQELVDTLDRLLGNLCTPDRWRTRESAGGFDAELHDQLVSIGLAGIGLPERDGGSGFGLLGCVLAAEVLGAHLAPTSAIDAMAAARALATDRHGALDDLLAGTCRVAFGITHAASGQVLVPWSAGADKVLLARPDVNPRLVDRPVEAISPAHVAGEGAELWADAGAGAGTTLVAPAAHLEHRLLIAAALVGAGLSAIRVGVDYARSRMQFGVPIGSFQAIAHPFADLQSELEGLQVLCRRAGWRLDDGDDLGREDALMAFVLAGDAAHRAARHALRTHGGYGFMLDYDIQHHYRRTKALARSLETADEAIDILADAMFPPGEAA